VELSFGQSWSADELSLDELVLDELVLVEVGEAAALVAASACPTPTPPSSVPAAMVVATTAWRILSAIPITSFPLATDTSRPDSPGNPRRPSPEQAMKSWLRLSGSGTHSGN
jgi:hypothetical protein